MNPTTPHAWFAELLETVGPPGLGVLAVVLVAAIVVLGVRRQENQILVGMAFGILAGFGLWHSGWPVVDAGIAGGLVWSVACVLMCLLGSATR